MNDFLSFRTNPHSIIQNEPHSVILNEVKNLYHKDPSLPLRMTKVTEKLRMTNETEKLMMTSEKRYDYTDCHSERQRRIFIVKMLHFVQHDSEQMIPEM